MTEVTINGTESVFFKYDAHGDLIPNGPQLTGPDDKVNLNRTSKVFQLLNWDYKVNNTFIANRYNRYGLPTEITNPSNGLYSEAFFGIFYATAKIEYDCK